MAHLEYFPQPRLDLQEEIQHHPKLQQLLANHKSEDFEVKLAEIGLYCNVVIDGEFTQKELDELCTLLIRRLRDKRVAIIY